MVHVGLLGPFQIRVRGEPIELTTGRLRALLATLAVSAGRAVPLERLVTAIWADELPGDPRRSVQTYVARLRSLLGGDVCVRAAGGYVLQIDPDHVDALRFVNLLDAAPDRPLTRERLREALALWRGTPFQDVPSPWLVNTEAGALTERYL